MLKPINLIDSVEASNSDIKWRAKESVESFQNVLKEFIKDVNQLQNEAGEAIEKAITGEISDIHDVMIAVEKAKTSFELLMEVRNKMLEAYKELMRLQV
ncbi:flagellar hook-basal body complex protein FliE [Candidatus Kryptobacter tengchongensis]|uniref:Flagellar hook-basal body complex protein FliE n=1 Tax=Kryptobacter tengchongensis TaxID=1643429 RepID=A0A656D111_KRYT1|nr:flagellar hook-basal body complex protein FliE [Candidatus Kryptobacter tengchongensis]CUS91245.1 flagellar hook-basal body complex protein FliE [Candidatus Kryptobacter tengchongensis]CUS97565.1 flagellar hook-basal body complex protein FliE [Candidatus Kryptobacter tengchongensis]CUU09665.1 flagellar hook-basal body complex protein FliE [Candidatus Kryptobacter tengchongensis]